MDKVHLPGSVRKSMPGAEIVRMADSDQVIDVSIYGASRMVRDRLPDPETFSARAPDKRSYLSQEEAKELLAADPEHLAAITEFLDGHGLKVSQQPECARSVVARGEVGKFQEAFDTKLSIWRHASGDYRGRQGPLSVPPALQWMIAGAFGFDNRRVGFSYSRRASIPSIGRSIAPPLPFLPTDLAKNYNFPAGTTGEGQTVAILAFNGRIGESGPSFGGGFDEAVLQDFFTNRLGLALPKIETVVVQGPGNLPDGGQISEEVMLDLTMVAATAPGAKIVVYFSEFSEQGWVNVINRIIQDNNSIVSCSYGNPETTPNRDSGSLWTNAAIIQVNRTFQVAALKGVSILCASGDNGSTDGGRAPLAHADFPASSPWVTACGGTRMMVDSGSVVETVWNDNRGDASGGGISDLFALPDYQSTANVPASVNPGHVIGRGLPDVAAVADPNTGPLVPMTNGDVEAMGGTSAAAPLWAGLVARLNEGVGTPVGFLNPFLYRHCATGVLNDITQGNNGSYAAAQGWDPCTGLGTPNGEKLLRAFRG